ncbi:hypothetical protein OG203_35710 [Nocardia sp. NBC_01499]|uniref:hypothetical protein n=1 Tax=Nocardia sp. NBC_01499 TaxID=2903597 RepID=UPI0038653112
MNDRTGDVVISGQKTMTPFDDIYDQPDPRAYFRALEAYEYRTPHHAQRIFRRTVAARTRARIARGANPRAVLDICCSYGINAALLNYNLTLDDLYAHYLCPQAAELTTAELIEWDRTFYAAHRRPDAVPAFGLDIAANAITYARTVGLLDEGFTENLETAPPTAALLDAARRTWLITITGGASFLSARTFRPLLAHTEETVWVAAFVLRTGSYEHIAECLAEAGLITERVASPTFPQRRFTSVHERRYAIDAVTSTGEAPQGKESDGYFHTALHLSRPAVDTSTHPVSELVAEAEPF